MAGLRKYKYEIIAELNGKPQIDGIFDQEDDALERAQYLLGLAKYKAIRVVKTSDRGKPETIFEKVYTGGSQATTISFVDESNYCGNVSEIYAYESRRTLVRIARSYCDEQCMIPLEILHNYNLLRSLERERRLIVQIFGRLAALQVRTRTLTAEDRTEQLEHLFQELLENARDRGPMQPAQAVFDRNGLSRLTEHVAVSFTTDEQDRVITFVLAQVLAKHRDWLQKLEALVLLSDESPSPAAIKVLDEAIAETLDGSAPIRALLGAAPDLATALTSLSALACGRLDDTLVGTSTALALNARIKALTLPATRSILLDRIAKSLDGTAKLTRLDRRADADAFLKLFALLREYGGFRGGGTMAAAVTRRAKTVLAEGSEDLPFERAVGTVLTLLPGTADRVGYLLDLLTTDLGRQRATLLAGHLGQLFTSVHSISDFLPAGNTGMTSTTVLSKLKPRLYGGGIPADLADAFMRKLERIAEQESEPLHGRERAPSRRRRHARCSPNSVRLSARSKKREAPLMFVYDGRNFPVDGAQPVFTMGRGPSCNIVVAGDSRIGEIHAVVNRVGDDFLLCDLSETGTYIAFRNQAPLVLKRNSIRLESEGVIVLGGEPGDKRTLAADRLILFRCADADNLSAVAKIAPS